MSTTKCPTCGGPYSVAKAVCVYCGAAKEGQIREVEDGLSLSQALEVIESNIDALD